MIEAKEKNSHLNEAYIHIVSSNMLQNELLLSFLTDKIGIDGECLDRFSPENLNKLNGSVKKRFILIDCKNIEIKEVWENIEKLKPSTASHLFVALCNVASGAAMERIAMNIGIHGLFYDNDPPSIIAKGIDAILNGDFWFSRKTLIKFVTEAQSHSEPAEPDTMDGLLTAREKEILGLMASGKNSRGIADDLCISIHTVKTHIYNIYSKINVNNRLQAVLWAAKYL